jgi:capsular polysaccharide biosynthesis protein
MELRDYWRAFRRRAWIPVLLAIPAMVAAAILAYSSKPTYTAAALVLAKGGNSGGDVAIGFPQAATSNTVALGVIQKFGLNESVDQLIPRVHVAFASGNLYRVTVTDAQADRAAALANEVARQAAALYLDLDTKASSVPIDPGLAKARDELRDLYNAATSVRLKFQLQHSSASTSRDVSLATQALQLQLEEDAAGAAYRNVLEQINRGRVNKLIAASGFDARLVDQAVARPDSSGRVIQVLSAGALALVLGIGLIFLLEYLDNSVRAPEIAEEIVGAPVIGVIPRATVHSLRAIKGGT